MARRRAKKAVCRFRRSSATSIAPTRITVRALDRDGEPFELDATDLLARCLQHEIDHLHGKLFIDYLSFLKRRSALSKWESMKNDFPKNIRKLPPDEIAGRHGEEAL